MNKQDTISALPGFGPLAQPERIEILDILRGFALLCILIVNWAVDTKWGVGYWDGFTATADIIAHYTIGILLDEKSWPMFSFLFGLGFAIQMQRAESRKGSFIAVYSRRLVILFLIGAAHYILTERDFVHQYAILGFLLLPLRKLKTKALIFMAFIFFSGVYIYSEVTYYSNDKSIAAKNSARTEIQVDSTILDSYLGIYESPQRTFFVRRDKDALFTAPNGDRPIRMVAESTNKFSVKKNSNHNLTFLKDSMGTVNSLTTSGGDPYRKIQSGEPVINGATLRKAANRGKEARTYATGSFREIVSMRGKKFWNIISSWITYLYYVGDTFPLFLLGLYAGRRRIFQNISNNKKFFQNVMWWGLIFGLVVQAVKLVWELWIKDDNSIHFWTEAFLQLIQWLGGAALGLGYLAALTLLLQRRKWTKRFAPFAPVGQMALTNYLLQSVAFVLLFFGYGLGWFGKFGAFGGLMLALLLFALQIVFSRWWLRHFRFGPFEWLWRSLTYWKFQPMSLKQEKKEILSS